MDPTEYACVFARPPRERLVAAERLLRAVPAYLDGTSGDCDLHLSTSTRYLALVLRAGRGLPSPVVARLAFWTARTGGGGFAVGDLSDAARLRLRGELNLCDRSARGIQASHLAEAAARLLRAVGSPPPAKGIPILAIDLDGPGREALRYEAERQELSFGSVLAPPVGDRITLAARARGQPAPVEGLAVVTSVVARADAAAGRPAGFSLRVDGPAPLQELLAAHVTSAKERERRAAPRMPVRAPVKVKPAEAAPDAALLRARIEYATDLELAADWIENLSHGGAFVRSPTPHPEGSRLVLDLTLPDGVQLAAQAVVTARTERGMGVRFVLTPEQDGLLAAAMARISARPRRALVVDDVALARQMLADALTARGFEVLTAADAADGIRRLSEELMALDLLVTDVRMPGMSGEELARFIRRAGGEADLTIVAVTGRLDPETERLLAEAGADAVLDKAVGPELIAAAADAALERKRCR